MTTRQQPIAYLYQQNYSNRISDLSLRQQVNLRTTGPSKTQSSTPNFGAELYDHIRKLASSEPT